MSLVVLIPLSIGMSLVALVAFLWALSNGQFDDHEGNAWRVFMNDDAPAKKGNADDRLVAEPDDRNAGAGL